MRNVIGRLAAAANRIGLAVLVLGGIATMAAAQTPSPRQRPHLPLELLPDTLAICRLNAGATLPSWADRPSAFLTVSRTAEELSITAVPSAAPR